jgi:hypothetical protein
MKTFLTICTCAMVTAGIYGFADMAVDVKNGKMIEYDRGDEAEEEIVAEESVAVAAAIRANDQTLLGKKMAMAGHEKAQQQYEEAQAFKKAQQKKKIKTTVVTEPVIREEVVIAEDLTELKADSLPEVKIVEEGFDYRDFSRGSSMKYEKSVKSKKNKKNKKNHKD